MNIGNGVLRKPHFSLIWVEIRIDGHGKTPRGVEGELGVKIDFRKTSFLRVLRRNFFLKLQGGSRTIKKG